MAVPGPLIGAMRDIADEVFAAAFPQGRGSKQKLRVTITVGDGRTVVITDPAVSSEPLTLSVRSDSTLPIMSAPPAKPKPASLVDPSKLSPLETKVVAVLKPEEPLPVKLIATAAGCACNSHLRRILARLCKIGVAVRTHKGYAAAA